MGKILSMNAVFLVLLAALSQCLQPAMLNFAQGAPGFLQEWFFKFPYGSIPAFMSVFSLGLPLFVLVRGFSKELKMSQSLAMLSALLLVNPMIVYSICGTGYSRFGLVLAPSLM